jgi:hypothetical protein
MEYGTLSCNIIVQNGVPNLNTFYVVRSKRKRFPPGSGIMSKQDMFEFENWKKSIKI